MIHRGMFTAMREQARQVIEEALRLPVAERAGVIAELLASLDGEPEPDAEAAWAAEIERRARRALGGESKGKDWQASRSDIEAGRARK